MLTVFILSGCSNKKAVSQEEYNQLKTELEELETEIAKLKNEVSSLVPEENIHMEENTPTVVPVEDDNTPTTAPVEEMTSAELELKLKEQPIIVVSTDYLIQDETYKSLYPDMLNAVIRNNSGKDIKNAAVAFAAWDKNNLPVKIVGEYDFSGGSYIQEVNYGDVNMIDGGTYGEDKGMSLDSDTNNIAKIKAIVIEYTDFDGGKWSNPYYETWKSIYEDKKLIE